jgi:hypothetical protein
MVDTNKKAELFLEKLKASDDMDVWIKDFYKSDAPQFKGKSKAKRRQMAVAAKLDAMDEGLEESAKTEDAPINSVGGGNIAGLGVGTQGEPGLTKKQQKKYKKKNIMRFKDYTTEDGPCWNSHKQVGMKKSKRTNKMVPNCVPK